MFDGVRGYPEDHECGEMAHSEESLDTWLTLLTWTLSIWLTCIKSKVSIDSWLTLLTWLSHIDQMGSDTWIIWLTWLFHPFPTWAM